MSAFRKPIAALVGVAAMLLAGLFLAVTPASAAPGSPAPTGPYNSGAFSISCSSSGCSGTLSGFKPGEGVSISYNVAVQSAHRAGAAANPAVTLVAATSYPLGGGTADSTGTLSFSFGIPATAPPGGTIVFTGDQGTVFSEAAPASFVGAAYVAPGSGSSSSASSGASSTNNSSGTLSSTGVAVVGIGALGVVLLVGGGLLLLAGRRRTGSAHI